MKQKILSISMLMALVPLNAQIFNSGFEDNNGTPLSAYSKINADGNTVAVWAPVQEFNTEAWVQFYDGYDNKIAFSTSSYDPEGTSNDWLITPAIDLPAVGKPTLYWKAKSYDMDFPDSYDVKISVTDNQLASFTTTLLSVDGEQAFDLNSRTLDLSAYQGKQIYIAFINKTTGGYYLALDDLYISNSDNCLMPDLGGLAVSGLSDKSFTASWDATAGISSVDVGLTDFNTPVTSLGVQIATTKSFNNLMPGKRYQLFLKNADCGSGWAGPQSVFTAANLPYSYDFEPTKENYGEYDSDGWSSSTWLNGNGTVAQSGTGYVFNNTSKTYAKKDWLFSYPIKLVAGQTAIVNYYAAMGSAAATPANLKLSVATAPQADSIMSDLATNSISGTSYQKYTASYTATQDGVYYFGFGNVTPPVAVSAALRIDNVSINTTSLSTQENKLESLNIYPNPANDKFYITGQYTSVDVYSTDGRRIKHFNKEEILEISNLPKQMYILKINTKQGEVIKKIIKD